MPTREGKKETNKQNRAHWTFLSSETDFQFFIKMEFFEDYRNTPGNDLLEVNHPLQTYIKK